MNIIDKAKEISGQAVDKAKEVSGQAMDKANELAGDDLIAKTILRMVEKQERINKLLAENGCSHRISGIEVENGLPPKAVFTVTQEV